MNRSAAQRLSGVQPPIREVPEQQTECFEILASLLDGAPGELQLRETQLPVDRFLSNDFPGLGGVDLTIERDDEPIALIELKFGSDTLWNSVWDLCKLALALRSGVGERGFMLGGAPLTSWEKERQGPDLFTDADYSTEALLLSYANCFRLWSTAPLRLPSTVRVESIDTVRFTNEDVPYEMRLVEVIDEGSDWLEISDEIGLRPE
jgi:hypothetical protein